MAHPPRGTAQSNRDALITDIKDEYEEMREEYYESLTDRAYVKINSSLSKAK